MRVYIGSAALLSALAIVFGLEVATGVTANDAGLISIGALPDTTQLNGEYWRVLSFGFLHWDLTHLLLNTGLLLAAGPIAEHRIGAVRLLLVFMVSSALSGTGILLKHLLLPEPGASVGASGGMFGLLGLALALVFCAPSRKPIVRYALLAVAAFAFSYSVLPGISMVGHVVGFTAGVAIGLAISRVRPNNWLKRTDKPASA